jgi:hypothetical protein
MQSTPNKMMRTRLFPYDRFVEESFNSELRVFPTFHSFVKGDRDRYGPKGG